MESALSRFSTNPALFLEEVIKEYVASSPGNRLTAFNNEPIFEEPLVGFADGDDSIFQDYKVIIGDFHLTPRESLGKHLRQRNRSAKQPPTVSVISWILPISYQTRLGMRRQTLLPTLRWNHTRWHGQDLINELSHYIISRLEELGYQAVAPELADFFERKELPHGLVSNWSQRHIAYAAGLGTFSLSEGLITPKGVAMRCGSVVTDAPLPPSPRVYPNHLAHCLFYREQSCRRCIERCPAGAISEQGHDKVKCREFMHGAQKAMLQKRGKEEGYIGRYLGCGLCQTKVPCESRIPPPVRRREQHKLVAPPADKSADDLPRELPY